MSLATIFIMIFFGLACVAALAAAGAIVYQLFQKLFRKKKPTSSHEAANLSPNRLLKKSFTTTFLCKKPNDFDGQFSKTWLIHQPAK